MTLSIYSYVYTLHWPSKCFLFQQSSWHEVSSQWYSLSTLFTPQEQTSIIWWLWPGEPLRFRRPVKMHDFCCWWVKMSQAHNFFWSSWDNLPLKIWSILYWDHLPVFFKWHYFSFSTTRTICLFFAKKLHRFDLYYTKTICLFFMTN